MNDVFYMNMALTLAKSTIGQTSPNPPVGAVVVKNGEILGFGSHLKAGEAHAEVLALTMAGDEAGGATLYVTLEPCNHYGRTPPCTESIIKSGVKRVVIATLDSNKKATTGAETLKQAGIDVEVGVLKREVEQIYEAFFHFVTTNTPFITLKTATSLDGKLATTTGESKWITGEKARQDVHWYRHIHDAILVGVNTVIADDPSLTVRLENGGKNPLRIILDTHLRTPLDAKVMTDHQADTWIFTGNDISEHHKKTYQTIEGVKIIQLNEKEIHIDHVLQELGQNGVMTLFVEGGSVINGSFLKELRVNQLITYIAPMVIGGTNAPTSFAGEGIQSLVNVLNLEIKEMTRIGEDIKIIASPKKGG